MRASLNRFVFSNLFLLGWLGLVSTGTLSAQVSCDPSISPANLHSVYTSGTGALLQWDAVPGSVGVRLRAVLPGGGNVSKTIVGTEPNQFLVPDASLSPGVYTWYVQATCNLVPPFLVTAISPIDTFAVGGAGTCPTTVSDVDGNVYSVVNAGTQCWMGANLKTTHYRDGSIIPGSLSGGAWSTSIGGAQAMYNGDPAVSAIYGLLYNQYAVVDTRGLCPVGWHVPDDAEWISLSTTLGGAVLAGGAMKAIGELGAGTGLWLAPNTGANNSSGFSALPGGYRESTGGYGGLNSAANWWSTTPFNLGVGWSWVLTSSSSNLSHYTSAKRSGFAVRCIQD